MAEVVIYEYNKETEGGQLQTEIDQTCLSAVIVYVSCLEGETAIGMSRGLSASELDVLDVTVSAHSAHESPQIDDGIIMRGQGWRKFS